MTWSFLLTSLIVVASPGTGVLYTLAAALTRGSRASVAAAFGCTLGIVPHFIAADEASVLARMLELSGAFMAMTFVVFVVYGLCAASVRERVISRPGVMAWLRRSFAAGFAALGAKLAFAE